MQVAQEHEDAASLPLRCARKIGASAGDRPLCDAPVRGRDRRPDIPRVARLPFRQSPLVTAQCRHRGNLRREYSTPPSLLPSRIRRPKFGNAGTCREVASTVAAWSLASRTAGCGAPRRVYRRQSGRGRSIRFCPKLICSAEMNTSAAVVDPDPRVGSTASGWPMQIRDALHRVREYQPDRLRHCRTSGRSDPETRAVPRPSVRCLRYGPRPRSVMCCKLESPEHTGRSWAAGLARPQRCRSRGCR